MRDWLVIVDCRVDNTLDNDFLTLNLWGKPVYEYPLEEVLKCDFKICVVLTDSDLIKRNVASMYGNKVLVTDEIDYKRYDGSKFVLVSGRAPLVKSGTLLRAVKSYGGGCMYTVISDRTVSIPLTISKISLLGDACKSERNAFAIFDGKTENVSQFELSLMEGTVINNKNDFELALILKKKELNASLLRKQILNRIEEKKTVFTSENYGGICLVGHSQIDFWNIDSIKNHKVRNCGIAGISSLEYYNDILTKNLLDCSEDIYLVMHGTNDIVYEADLSEIIKNIERTINYIKERKPGATIYFLTCLKVNGRLDRDNKTIDKLNDVFSANLKNVRLIYTGALNDEFGLLKSEYTKDGLHLSDKGYEILQNIVEEAIDE